MRQNTFENKKLARKMLIEQNIEFELMGPEHLVVLVLQQLVIFMTKQKSLRKIFDWIIIYC